MNRVLNVGLIGYGMAGQTFHAPIISAIPGLKLKTVVERTSAKSKEHYPWVKVVPDPQAVLEDETIDLVVIATPNATHFELAKQALLRGRHVVVEKPFTVTSQEAKELIDLARQQNLRLSVYQNRRWDGDFITVKRVLENHWLGRITEYEAHFDRYRNALKPNTWKEKVLPGSGIVYDLGSHLLDQAQMLFGLPQSITADIRSQRDGTEVEDNFEIILAYTESLKVTLKAGMLVRELGPHFMLHGTQGSFVKYGLDPQESALKRGLRPQDDPHWGTEPEAQWGKLNAEIAGLHFQGNIETTPGDYRSYYKNVYEAIVSQEDLFVKPEQARNTIRMIELAIESNHLKKTLEFTE